MTHQDLVRRASTWLRNTLNCGVVLTERQAVGYTVEIPDAIGWKAGFSHLVECKASRNDFLKDRHKAHRRNPETAMGHFRYYMVPDGLVLRSEVPLGFGLIEVGPARRARLTVKPLGFPGWNQRREMGLLLSELRRYQLHGITYPPLAKGRQPLARGLRDLMTTDPLDYAGTQP